MLQRFAGDPTTSLEFISAIAERMDVGGMSFREAHRDAIAAGIQPQVPQPGAGGELPAPEGAQPGEPGADQAALLQGAIPGGAPPIPGTFTPPPLQQVFVK